MSPRIEKSQQGEVKFQAVKSVIEARCAGCHAAKPSFPGIAEAPKGIMLDTPERIRAQAATIHAQTVAAKAMPPGNLTQMTGDERVLLDRWYRSGARTE